MPFLIIVVIMAACLFEYCEKSHWLPHGAAYVQEVAAVLAMAYVVIVGVRDRFRLVRSAYWIVFGAIVVIMLCGIAINAVNTGPIFAGTRNYLRAIPFFFVPAVYAFRERQIKTQLTLLLGLCFLQIPLAVYQRLATAAHKGFTGDETVGTLMNSAILSIFLISAACMLTGFYLKKRLGFWSYVLMLPIIIFPTMINETKGTLLLLPFGLFATFVLGAPRNTRLRNFLLAAGLVGVSVSAFVVVYDYSQEGRPYKKSIVEFFMEGKAEQYVDRGTGFGAEQGKVGRMDAIRVPFGYLAQDPMHVAFGLGLGNASNSSLGPRFTGKYFQILDVFLQLTVIRLFVEMGILGLSLVLALMYLIFKDACAVAETDDTLVGAVAVGWIGATAVITLAMFYKDLLPFGSISFLFWYFSGLVAAHRMRLAGRARA